MTWANKGRVAIAGIGFSPIERRSRHPLGTTALTAAKAAVADSGLSFDDIDGLATYPTAPFAGAVDRDGEDIVTVGFFLDQPWLRNIVWYSQAGEGMVVTAIRDAVNALIAGACSHVLVWRAMYVPPGTYGRAVLKEAGGDQQFSAPYGCLSPIQFHAMSYRSYLETYGKRREQMAALVLNSRANANRNEHAIFRDRALTLEDYQGARMISDPLCLLDCDVPVTACVAMVLTTAERARDLRNKPAFVAAVGQQTASRHVPISYTTYDHIESGGPMCDRMWRDAGFAAKDLSAGQLYDGFAPSTLYWLEAAGFCGRGEALDWIQDGRIAIGGEMPINTFGGSLSQGRLHGMGHVAEGVMQVTDRAGPRQIPGAHAVAVFDGSPMLRGSAMIVTRDP